MKMNLLKQLFLVTGLLFFGIAQASAPSSAEDLSVWIQNTTDGTLELRRAGAVYFEILPGETQEFLLENLQDTTLWVASTEGHKKKVVTTIGWRSGRVFKVKTAPLSNLYSFLNNGPSVGFPYVVWSKTYNTLPEREEYEGSSDMQPAPFFNNMTVTPIYFLTASGVVLVPSSHSINFYTGELSSLAWCTGMMREDMARQHAYFKKLVREEVEYPALAYPVFVASQQDE